MMVGYIVGVRRFPMPLYSCILFPENFLRPLNILKSSLFFGLCIVSADLCTG